MRCSQIHPRIQVTTLGKDQEITNCFEMGSNSFQQWSLAGTSSPFFPKTQKANGAALAAGGTVPSMTRGHLAWYWLLKEKSLWHTDRGAQDFHFAIPDIYLISCWLCLWIIHFYKNNIIPLRSAYLPIDISRKAAVYCVFILKLACFTREYIRLSWRTM